MRIRLILSCGAKENKRCGYRIKAGKARNRAVVAHFLLTPRSKLHLRFLPFGQRHKLYNRIQSGNDYTPGWPALSYYVEVALMLFYQWRREPKDLFHGTDRAKTYVSDSAVTTALAIGICVFEAELYLGILFPK
jgi:hypothetical protein